MTKFFDIGKIIIWLVLGVYSCSSARATVYQVKDDSGQLVQLNYPAHRIISLAPDITELLFAAGAGPYVIGVSRYSDYPVAAKKLPVVADYGQIDIERVLAMKPDLIIAWQDGNSAQQIALLRQLGQTVYLTSPKTIPDIAKNLQNFGVLAGTTSTANKAAWLFMQRYQKLKATYSNQIPVTVFYQLQQIPLITSNKNSLINQVIELCGGKNIFANLKENWPVISLAAVLQANPQVILATPPTDNENWQSFWLSWQDLQAVKNGYLFTINSDIVVRYGPRLLDGATQICQDLNRVRIKLNKGESYDN